MRTIYVFGTDTMGKHENFHAKEALRFHGAQPGRGAGLYGNSYAIPITTGSGTPLHKKVLETNILRFIQYVSMCVGRHKDITFRVMPMGKDISEKLFSEVAFIFKSSLFYTSVEMHEDYMRYLRPRKAVKRDTAARELIAIAMNNEGKSSSLIAKRLGITNAGVHYILKRVGAI